MGLLLAVDRPATAQASFEAAASGASGAVVRLSDVQASRVPLGSRVRVRGRVSVPAGVLRASARSSPYVDDGAGGLRLRGAEAMTADEGAWVDAVGILGDDRGERVLEVQELVVGETHPVPVAPLRVREPSALPRAQGRLVTLRGVVASHGQIAVGESLGMLVGDSLVYVVRFSDAPFEASFAGFATGQQVEVTGVLGRYRTAVQLYPRVAADVKRIGLAPSAYRTLALLAAGLLLLALAWAIHLVRVGQRRLTALSASQVRFELLFDHSDTGVMVQKPTAGGARVLRANAAVYRVLGLDAERVHLEGASVHEVARLLNPDALRQHVDAVMETGRDAQTVLVASASGAERAALVETIRVDQDDEVLLFSFLTDITERLARERALVDAREKAEAFAQMQGTFLRNISHELRTPLAGIIGFAEVLRHDLDGEHDEFASYIEQAGRRLLRTLQDVLDLTRYSSEAATLTPQRFDLAALVTDVLGAAKPDTDASALSTERDVPHGLELVHDEQAMRRVLDHLVANAIKFTLAGGTVAVRAVARPDGRVHIAVEDTGIGMSEAFQEHLFHRFAQESNGYDRTHEGVGLGLHLVRTLVAQMRGTIRVDSAQGVGTTVTLDLPQVADAAALTAPTAA